MLGTQLFRDLTQRQMVDILQSATVTTYSAPGLLFNQGDKATFLYVLLEGMVSISIYHADGRQALIDTVRPVNCFAEAAAFLFGYYPATAEFTAKTRVLAIPVEDLKTTMINDPDLGHSMLRSLAEWERHLTQQLRSLRFFPPVKRLISFLSTMLPADARGPHTVSLPFDKKVLARNLGITPESLSRLFSRLAEAGVETKGKLVFIQDVDVLRQQLRDTDNPSAAARQAK
ncbi:MAG: Crp/Fnr family transcriptional regulator [Magnetospiraceae bacterium]